MYRSVQRAVIAISSVLVIAVLSAARPVFYVEECEVCASGCSEIQCLQRAQCPWPAQVWCNPEGCPVWKVRCELDID